MVILLGLIFLLDIPTQDQSMKISSIFFRALFHLICIYKVQANFWNCLNRLEKGFNLPGHVSHLASTRGGLSVWALGACGALGRYPGGVSRLGHSGHVASSGNIRRVALGLGFWDTWQTRKASGGFSQRQAFGTCGKLGRCLGKVLPVEALGTRGVPGTLPG